MATLPHLRFILGCSIILKKTCSGAAEDNQQDQWKVFRWHYLKAIAIATIADEVGLDQPNAAISNLDTHVL